MSNHVSVMVTLVTLMIIITVGLTVVDVIESSELEELESEGEAETLDEAAKERIEAEIERTIEMMVTGLTGLVMSIHLGRGVNGLARQAVTERAGLTP